MFSDTIKAQNKTVLYKTQNWLECSSLIICRLYYCFLT